MNVSLLASKKLIRYRFLQVRLDHLLTDQRLLLDHTSFLQAGTNIIKDERRMASAAMEQDHHELKEALVQEVLQLRSEVIPYFYLCYRT